MSLINYTINSSLLSTNYSDSLHIELPTSFSSAVSRIPAYRLSVEDLAENIAISNKDFILAAFAGDMSEAKPLFHFVENIQEWSSATDSCNGSPATNAYYSVSSFLKSEDGSYQRRINNFAALHVVVLDDLVPEVKTKEQTDKARIPFSKITLEPSYVIETSQNNFQVGFFLDTPISDPEVLNSLEERVIQAGLTDKGANGWRTRVMRLPNGINTKKSPAFHCRLRLWKPENRYSAEEIITGLNLPILSKVNSQKSIPLPKSPNTNNRKGNHVWTPKPTTNPVLEKLKERGLVKREIESGKYEISCPWCGNHTDELDSGAAYWGPNEEFPIGGFHCMHAHCQNKTIKDLLTYLGISYEDAKMVAKIRIMPNAQPEIVEGVEQTLTTEGSFFRHLGQLVHVIKTKSGKAQIVVLDSSTFLTHTTPYIHWFKQDNRKTDKAFQPSQPSQELIKAILNNGESSIMPILNGIIEQPMLRGDGSLVMANGYDPVSEYYCDFDISKYNIPPHPSKEDAVGALNHLAKIFSEFSFESEVDRSAAIAAAFTATLRQSLDVAPMFLVRAHTKGSGKSYCCSLISAFASEQDSPTIAMPKDEQEMGKIAIAQILANKKVVIFDNLVDDIKPFPTLCSLITSQEIEGRVLGRSQIIKGSTKILLLSSGNNIDPTADMTRRVITINLDPKIEIPALRRFSSPNLLDKVREERHRYISDVLTIVLAWIQSGKPRANVPSIGSFNQWSDFCRQPLLWLGLEDPVQSMVHAIKYDPQRLAEGRLISWLRLQFGNNTFRTKDIVEVAEAQNAELREALVDLDLMKDGVANSKSIGRWLSRKEGEIFNGERLVCMDKRRKIYQVKGGY